MKVNTKCSQQYQQRRKMTTWIMDPTKKVMAYLFLVFSLDAGPCAVGMRWANIVGRRLKVGAGSSPPPFGLLAH